MLQAQHWERHLQDMAFEALNSDVNAQDQHIGDQLVLDAAYDNCRTITRENSKTFFLASSLLPEGKRQAIQSLYAFCRVSDDLVDRSIGDTEANLGAWRHQVISPGAHLGAHAGAPINEQVRLAWLDARRAFSVPLGYVEQLLDGLALDLKRVRYQTFDELAQYCYGVACTVGLMSMHIVGYRGTDAIPYAIRLGVALQLTNILRDVGEDWQAGRLYLPLDELQAFGLCEDDIAAGRVDDRWRAFMDAQIERTRRLYAEALPGVAYLHPDGRFAIAAAGELYQAILKQIEANDYDVFSRRASVSALGKLRRLPGIWWRAQTASPERSQLPAR